jgi:hypothetical protein
MSANLCRYTQLEAVPQGTEKCAGVGVCIRRFIIYYSQWRQGAENSLFLLHRKASGALCHLMLDKLCALLARSSISLWVLGHGLLRLRRKPSLH